MIRALRNLITAYRFRKMTRHFDLAEREARRKHKPVKHIQAARTAFIHDCLRGA